MALVTIRKYTSACCVKFRTRPIQQFGLSADPKYTLLLRNLTAHCAELALNELRPTKRVAR